MGLLRQINDEILQPRLNAGIDEANKLPTVVVVMDEIAEISTYEADGKAEAVAALDRIARMGAGMGGSGWPGVCMGGSPLLRSPSNVCSSTIVS